MSIQLVAIIVVLGLALGVFYLGCFALAACQLSSKISRHEEQIASAKGDYLADNDNEE